MAIVKRGRGGEPPLNSPLLTEKEIAMKERMTLDRWYGGSVRIPGFHHGHVFCNFVSSSLSIVRSIVTEHFGKDVVIRFMKSGTACADVYKGIIYINEDFLTGNFPYNRVFDSSLIISSLLGIIVHEAAHFAYSPETLEPQVDFIRTSTTRPFNFDVARGISNIVEDIYIEAEADRCIPSLTWTLEWMNETFFTKEHQAMVVETAKEILSAPTELKVAGDVLNALILAKIQPTIEASDYIKHLFLLARGATELQRLADRKELCLSLYEKVMEKMSEEEAEEKCQLDDGKMLDPKDGKAQWVKDAKTDIAKAVEKMMKDYENCDITFDNVDKDGVSGFTPTTIYIEEYIPPDAEEIEVDKRYLKLAEVARQKAVVNRPYGLDKKRGSRLRKLYRIGTDQKVFAESVDMKSYKPMQVMVVIDCSGSMAGSAITDATKAAVGATIAMAEARCEVALYGHTSDYTQSAEVILYRIKGFNESIEGIQRRAKSITDHRKLHQNRDGYAVQFLAKKMRDTRKRRLMIVISDGEPYAPEYRYEAAIEHSSQMVRKVREMGIDVLSISITEEAEESNNVIYGRENNVCNEDPNVIEQIVRRLID